MASSPISNPLSNTDRSAAKRRKKKKSSEIVKHHLQQDQIQNLQYARWKSHSQQQIYSSKLRQALARLNIAGADSDAPRRGKAVREAADRVLAVAAKGKTRWSRAILTSRLKLKFRKQHKRQRITAATATATATGNGRSRKPRVSVFRLKGKSLPTVQRKVRFLGRLVPGCRKQPLPVVLEETIDYISALQMQIRAMTDLANRLSGGSTSFAAGDGDGEGESNPNPSTL